MSVAYPRKFGSFSARTILEQVVRDREVHMITLNRYRFSEQRSCKDLTELVEKLDGEPRELVRDLSRHISDEARHAMWLTDLLHDLGAPLGRPPGTSYIDEFERLLDTANLEADAPKEDLVINSLAAINVTEKRGCEYFSSHIAALKAAPPSEENQAIQGVLEQIFPEEAAHVRWGNRWLATLSRQSTAHRQKVEAAKIRYASIEQAAFESGMDITLGAELRRVERLLGVTATLPAWQRPAYFMERLPQTLLAPDLQGTRLDIAQRAWKRDPQAFFERFIPLFLNGPKAPAKQAASHP
ncbi:MAG: ferritin-like domain-containing protein [Gloeomargaritaceae cyanobacterium C42_A2020_066]|nr:ferritin-like domain-containing protein [Gloeomargaritaceae cyanobacterium C42_A2020_066]